MERALGPESRCGVPPLRAVAAVAAAPFLLGSMTTGSGGARVEQSKVASCSLVEFVFCLSISAQNKLQSPAPAATVR